MKFEYFILIPFVFYSAKAANESCLDSCGQKYDVSFVCQCNTACKKHGDCCNDFVHLCLNGSCVSKCGKPFNNKPQCQCNTACTRFKNCCDDFDTLCLLAVNESTTTNYINSETTFITSVDELSTTNYVISHETTFTTSVDRTTRIEENRSGMIAGVIVSLTIVMLIVVVIIVFVYRRIRLRKQVLSKTVGNGKRASKMNYYSTEDVQEDQYHDIDVSNGDYCLAAAVTDDTGNSEGTEDGETTYARPMSGVYDELNGKDKRKIPTKYQNENASKLDGSKSEIYTLTSNLTFNQQTKDNNSSAKWQTPDAVDFDPTYNHSNNVILREDLSNYDHFSNQ